MKNSIGRLVSILHRQAQVYINCVLKEFNITSAEYFFLLHLYKHEGITQDQLSAHLYIDKSATTRAISSLETKGYVIRGKDSVDKRCNRVYLSDQAKECKDEILKRVWRWSEFLTDGMEEEQIDLVISALEQMVAKVESMNIKKGLEA